MNHRFKAAAAAILVVPAGIATSAQASIASPQATDAQALQAVLAYNSHIESYLVTPPAGTSANRPLLPRLRGEARSLVSSEVDRAIVRKHAMAAAGTFVSDVSLTGTVVASGTSLDSDVVGLTIIIKGKRALSNGIVWEDETWQFVEYSKSTGELLSIDAETEATATAGDDLIEDGSDTPNGPPSSNTLPATVQPAQRSSRHHSGLNDKGAAVNYALTWAMKKNPNYVDYSSDCTNFVSQAMRAGGWNMVDGGGSSAKKSSSNWFHHSKSNVSRTWGGAENFFQFGRNKVHRLNPLTNVYHLNPGDVLQADWDGNDNINHTMIATKKGTRDVYMTYHTPARKNRPLSAIVADNPGALWYASWT